jgi:DNA polymerase-3 subunit beta
MKFIISSTYLLKHLQSISGVLNSSNTLPILDNFLFELNGKILTISASDLETTMTADLDVDKADKNGNVAVPAKILLDTLKTFSDIPLTFNIDGSNFGIEISAGEGNYKISGYNAAEFPKIPVMESAATIEISSSMLSKAINKTIFATGNDELRPVMSGVFCQLSPENFTFVATDAHKLVRYRRTDAKSDKVAAFILPKKPLIQLKNVLTADETPVRIEYNQTNAYFAFGNISLICRLIDGKYPNYDAVIPTENPNKLSIERISFLNAIKRVSIFANQSTHQIRLKMSGRELTLSAEDLDFSNEAKERLTCQFVGEDMEIGFNSKFLLEMIMNLETDEICIEMSAPNRAGILFPVNNDNKAEEVLMLVMPVMLNT